MASYDWKTKVYGSVKAALDNVKLAESTIVPDAAAVKARRAELLAERRRGLRREDRISQEDLEAAVEPSLKREFFEASQRTHHAAREALRLAQGTLRREGAAARRLSLSAPVVADSEFILSTDRPVLKEMRLLRRDIQLQTLRDEFRTADAPTKFAAMREAIDGGDVVRASFLETALEADLAKDPPAATVEELLVAKKHQGELRRELTALQDARLSAEDQANLAAWETDLAKADRALRVVSMTLHVAGQVGGLDLSHAKA